MHAPLPVALVPQTLRVPYIGKRTVKTLARHLEDLKYLPINDKMLSVTFTGWSEITYDFSADLAPRYDLELKMVVPKRVSEVVASLEVHSKRGLNIPETLALSRKHPDRNFVAFGQPLQREFGRYVACVIRKGLCLLPYDRCLSSGEVPVTTCPDPLV